MLYTVTLNPALDYVVHTPMLNPGSVQRAYSATLTPAGKGINVARMLVQLGKPVQAVGFKAGWTGDAVEEAMKALGCAGPFFSLGEGQTRINVKLRHGEETDINLPGPPVTPDAWLQLMHWAASVPVPGDTVVLSGSVPPPLGEEAYAAILILLAPGVRAVVDAEGDLLRQTLPYHPFLIKPNREELSALMGRKMDGEDDIVRSARNLHRAGARNVLVSLGGDGAILVNEGGVWQRKAPTVEVCNTVGAGDAMLAGFLYGYDETQGNEAKKLSAALDWGIAAGSATAACEGIADAEAVRKLLAGGKLPQDTLRMR